MISGDISDQLPPLNGLVLAGGDSSRMGFDKGLIHYHGLPQREYLFHLLQPLTAKTFISVRPGHIGDSPMHVLEDRYPDLGPFGAILTAFEYDSDSAWLVVACDFPLLDGRGIIELIDARDPASKATSFLDPHTLMPEPWMTILEPSIYPLMQSYHQRGKQSLRGILVDYNTKVVRPSHPDILLNANTPEEALLFQEKINGK